MRDNSVARAYAHFYADQSLGAIEAELDQLEFGFRWPSGDGRPLFQISVRAAELAQRNGLQLRHWDEDGLGPASGFVFRTDGGDIFVVQELAHAIEHLGSEGPTIWADKGSAETRGVAAVVDACLGALGIYESDVTWIAQAVD